MPVAQVLPAINQDTGDRLAFLESLVTSLLTANNNGGTKDQPLVTATTPVVSQLVLGNPSKRLKRATVFANLGSAEEVEEFLPEKLNPTVWMRLSKTQRLSKGEFFFLEGMEALRQKAEETPGLTAEHLELVGNFQANRRLWMDFQRQLTKTATFSDLEADSESDDDPMMAKGPQATDKKKKTKRTREQGTCEASV